jgi:tetratricopeptide (TPR) repeat protein
MGKSRSFLSIAVPSGTVFLSSFCIMVLELVAARLIARHLGSSLYTWTAVIGVVLAGITIGNYLGGRIADSFKAGKALAVLFALASAACVITVVANNLVGGWVWLWRFGWPMRVFSHVSLVFLLPSVLLGTISPVVAKMALEQGLPTGRTVGDIYAWGAAGSIAGTFATGYYLIAAMGTTEIIWTVGGVLLLLAICYWAKLWVLYVWAAIFIALLALGLVPAGWANEIGAGMALREKPDPAIIYEDESQYCYIAVKRISENPDRRAFMQDKLKHSDIVMGDILDLQYSYSQIQAAVTQRLNRGKDKLSVLVIGGGGYVFPRYVEHVWPGSRVDVVEIDPGVTKAAIQAFGLERNSSINNYTMDARNYVIQLLEQERAGGQAVRYDFIFEDALNDYSVPYQLTTRQFNDKIARILTDRGAYMIELIDIYDSGLFVGAFVNTLERTFDYVYVVAENEPRSARITFVVIAAKHQINLENLAVEEQVRKLDLWVLSDSEIETLRRKARGIVLTDDYAPVENLLSPVVLASARDLLAEEYLAQAERLKTNEKWEECILKFEDVIKVDPAMSIQAYNERGMIEAGRGRPADAIEAFKSALEYNEKAEVRQSMSNIHYNIGIAFQRLGDSEQAATHLQNAVRGYREDFAKEPGSAKIAGRLGNALATVGNFTEAAQYFRQAVNLDPFGIGNHSMLAQALAIQGRYDEAIAELQKAIGFMSQTGNDEAAGQLKKLLEIVELKQADQKK